MGRIVVEIQEDKSVLSPLTTPCPSCFPRLHLGEQDKLQQRGEWVFKRHTMGDFPGSPVVKTSPSNAGGMGLIPGQGAKIPHASCPKNQNIKQKQYCNKFNTDFKKIEKQTNKQNPKE